MEISFIKELNALIKKFQANGNTYLSSVGKGESMISSFSDIVKTQIPEKLKEVFPESIYKITGSIGKGRVAFCPWIAIMDKKITTSTQNGVYLVFLFSQDLKNVYFSLAQGITNLPDDEIKNTRNELRRRLNLESDYLRHFNNQEISGNKAEKWRKSILPWMTTL